MPGRRNNADTYRRIPVLLCVFLFVMTAGIHAQFKPCEVNGKGKIIFENQPADVKRVRIVEMPTALYPDSARDAGVQGTVTLKVRFLAGGRIGFINVISELPEGLTGEAVRAARKIKFGPARKNARMIHTEEIVEYNFSDPGKCQPGTAHGVSSHLQPAGLLVF